jgi:ubiquinone/menaquinone biosynthesis C-methylase UbiE
VDQLEGVPLKAALASLGCGNPTALAELHAGEVVLDLGSGGGIDVLLSARRVGPAGHAYGLDMTDAMLELARRNAEEAGATNVTFLKGDIASIPLPDNSVDVIISNCVINLAADKTPVLREAFRVLKPGGRFAVSDIVIHGELPAEVANSDAMRRDLSSWSGCIAGALTDREYREGLAAAGFMGIDLEITRRYSLADVPTSLTGWAASFDDARKAHVVEQFASTFVRAVKPRAM